MKIIKFDLNQLEKMDAGFAYYLLGRSYDLEENGLKRAMHLYEARSRKK